jgi:hypothetical protein
MALAFSLAFTGATQVKVAREKEVVIAANFHVIIVSSKLLSTVNLKIWQQAMLTSRD